MFFESVKVVYLDHSDYLEAVSGPKIKVSQIAPTTTSKNMFSRLEHLKVQRRTNANNSTPLISKNRLVTTSTDGITKSRGGVGFEIFQSTISQKLSIVDQSEAGSIFEEAGRITRPAIILSISNSTPAVAERCAL